MKRLFLVACWMVAFIAASLLDTPIARAVHDSGFGHRVAGQWWSRIMKEPGEIRFTVAVVLLLWLCRQIRWKQAVFVLLAGVASGLNVLIKWFLGRYRPYKFPGASDLHPFSFHPFGQGFYGLFHQHDLCFPSGHECTAGALAASIFIVWPRGRWIFVAIAVMVGVERVMENAHFTSDVVGAMGFAMLEVSVLNLIWNRWMNPAPDKGFEVVFSHTSPETSGIQQ